MSYMPLHRLLEPFSVSIIMIIWAMMYENNPHELTP